MLLSETCKSVSTGCLFELFPIISVMREVEFFLNFSRELVKLVNPCVNPAVKKLAVMEDRFEIEIIVIIDDQ